jgi:hypothetical protein
MFARRSPGHRTAPSHYRQSNVCSIWGSQDERFDEQLKRTSELFDEKW